MASPPLGENGSGPSCFERYATQPTLWVAVLPAEFPAVPEGLARVDALLDDPGFLAPLAPFFDPTVGRPSIPMETYLRLMLLKFRYRLGYESLCREVGDSISWRRPTLMNAAETSASKAIAHWTPCGRIEIVQRSDCAHRQRRSSLRGQSSRVVGGNLGDSVDDEVAQACGLASRDRREETP